MTYKIKLVCQVSQSTTSRVVGLTRKQSGGIVETRLRPAFEKLAPHYEPKIEHSARKGEITIELTMPATGPSEARRKTLYWVDRIAGVQNISFDHDRITSFEVTPVA